MSSYSAAAVQVTVKAETLASPAMEPWLERAAALRPNRTAVEAEDGSRTYAELLDRPPGGGRVGRAGRRPRGDRAAGRRRVRRGAARRACCAARRRCPSTRGWRTASETRSCARPRRSSTSRGPAARRGVVRRPHEDDVALVMHTSGTTGAPRAVELSYGNVLAQAHGSAAALGLDPDERWLCPLPLSHVGGLMVLLRSAIYATTAVIGPPDRDDVTLASMVPTQLARLLDRPPPSLRAVLLGGAAADRGLLTSGSRRRLARGAHVRPHPGVLVGDDRRGRRHRDLGPSAPRRHRLDRARRRDPGRRPDRRGRRHAAHRRPRPARRPRPPDRHRPQGRHDRQRGRERGARRGRGRPARAPRGRRGRRLRAAAPGVGRGGDRPRRPAHRTPPRPSCAPGRASGSPASRSRRRSRSPTRSRARPPESCSEGSWRDLPGGEPPPLADRRGRLGEARRRPPARHDARDELDARRARAAARPPAARARGRDRRHRLPRRRADPARRHADHLRPRAGDAQRRPAPRRDSSASTTCASARSTPRRSTSRPPASTACSPAGATC